MVAGAAIWDGGLMRLGLKNFGGALLWRYGSIAGPFYGGANTPAISPLGENAFKAHDVAYGIPGSNFSPARNGADKALVGALLRTHNVGPIGQVYRFTAAAAFGLKIGAQSALGAAGVID